MHSIPKTLCAIFFCKYNCSKKEYSFSFSFDKYPNPITPSNLTLDVVFTKANLKSEIFSTFSISILSTAPVAFNTKEGYVILKLSFSFKIKELEFVVLKDLT